MRLMKSGTSSATNLDMFMSRSVRIIRNDSLLQCSREAWVDFTSNALHATGPSDTADYTHC